MRLDYRGSILVTAVGATLVALLFVWLITDVRPDAWSAWPSGSAPSSPSSARRRSRRGTAPGPGAIADVGRRYALGDLSRPGPTTATTTSA